MRTSALLPLATLILALGCSFSSGQDLNLVRDQILPSGKKVKVTGLNLAFGARDSIGNDCFKIDFVYSNPTADQQQRDAEAAEVFELIRPVSEQWGLKTAEVSAYPTEKHQGILTFYRFSRSSDNKWSSTRMNGHSY